jgi:hypothetical protein
MAQKTALAKKPPVSPEQWIQQGDKQPEPPPPAEGLVNSRRHGKVKP